MVLDSTDPYYDLALADLRVKVHQLAETRIRPRPFAD
jgi:hypothetical protein